MSRPTGTTTTATDIESLFLWEGRGVRWLERLGLAHGGRLRPGPTAAFLVAMTWLPLVVLSLVEGVGWGDAVEVPLLGDLLPYGRFLVAVPVLALGDAVVGRHLGRAMAELQRSDVLAPEGKPALYGLLARVVAGWRGRAVNPVLLLVTLVATALSLLGERDWLTGTWQYVGGRLTMSGWWYLAVSLSILRFLTLRWLWRLLLWAWLLSRVAGLKLQPRPTHPDRAGGLAFLGATQASFGVLVFALSVQLSCLLADGAVYEGADLMAFRGHVAAFVLLVVGAFLLPLLPFAPKLARAREDGLVLLSGSGYDGAGYLEGQLSGRSSGQLPADDVSGLADFGALYENARRMRTLPLDPKHLVVIVVAALAPTLPLGFIAMPAEEVLRTLRQLIF